MNIFENIKNAFGNAAEYVGDRSRRAAYLNRIRSVISCEESAAEKEYLALGRYYYNNLRDKENGVAEAHCAELDGIQARLDKAIAQLEQFYQQEADAIGAADDDFSEEITLDDVECFDSDPMTDKVAEVKEKAVETVAEVKEKAAETVEKVTETVTGKVKEIMPEIVSRAKEAVENVPDMVSRAKEAVENAAGNVPDMVSRAKEAVENAAEKLTGKTADKVEEAADPEENDTLPFEG